MLARELLLNRIVAGDHSWNARGQAFKRRRTVPFASASVHRDAGHPEQYAEFVMRHACAEFDTQISAVLACKRAKGWVEGATPDHEQ